MAKISLKRWVFMVLGLLVLLLIVGLAVAFNSGVQTSIVRNVLLKRDPQAKLESVSFGLGSGEVKGLEMNVAGYPVKIGSLTVEYSLFNLLFGHTKTIDSATVKDFVFDASQPPKKTATAPTTPSAGGKGPPLSALIVKASLEGTALLPSQRAVQLSFTAQTLGSASDGKATGTVIFQDKSPGAKVGEMRAETQLSLALDDTMMPKNLDLLATLAANMPGQTQTSKIQAHAQLKPLNAASGEFTLTLSPPDAGAATLFAASGTYGTAGSASGEFSANLTRAQIEPFAFGFKLPDFSLQGQGQFAADAPTRTGSLKTTMSGSAGHLETIAPQLAGLGTVQLTVNVDTAVAPGKSSAKALALSAKTLSFTLAPQGQPTAVAVELLKPATLEYGDKGIVLPPGAGAELARLTLTQAPPIWLTAVLPKEFSVLGQGFNGQITLGVRDDGALTATTTQPVSFAGLDVQQNGKALLTNGVIQLDFSAQYLAKAVSAQVRNFSFSAHEISAPGATLVTAALGGTAVQAQFAGNVSLQPGATMPEVAATGNFTLAVDVDNLDRKALGQNLPLLPPAGLLKLNSVFDVATIAAAADPKNSMLVVNTFQTTLTKGAGTTAQILAAANALQKISLPLAKDAALPSMTGNLATIEIDDFPLAIAQMFLPAGVKFSGNPLKGKLLLVGAGGADAGIVLHTTEPLTVANAKYTQNTDDKLANVTLTFTPEGSWQGGAITGNVHALATAPEGVLLDATITASQIKDTLSGTVTLNGQLAALAAQPLGASWRSYLPATQPQYSVSASFSRTPKSMTLATAEAHVGPAAGAALADIKLNQAVTLQNDPAAKPDATGMAKFLWPNLNGDVLSIKLSSLPAGVLSMALPGYHLLGREISADLAVRGTGNGAYVLTSNAPITAAGLSVEHVVDKDTTVQLVHDLTFTIKPSATVNQDGLAACGVEDLQLTSGNAVLAQGNFTMTRAAGQTWPQQATISLQSDLAQVLKQPVLAKFNNLATGKLQIDGALAADGSMKLNADVSNWAMRGAPTQVTHMVFSNVTGKFDRATNAVQLTLPVKGDSKEGPTDCVLAFNLDPSADPKTISHKFTLNLTGSNLVLDDLMAVKSGLAPPAAPPTTAPMAKGPAPAPVPASAPAPVVPDTIPIWGDWQGAAKIQLASIRFHAFAITNFTATAQVSPTKAEIPAVAGIFEGAPLSLKAALGFAPHSTTPYDLATDMSFKNFDVGAYFKERDDKATPPVEGNFSISGNASGQGATIDDLIDKVQFDMAMNSSGGTFHMLDLVANKIGVSSGALKTVTSIAGGILSMLGKKDPTGLTSTAGSIGTLLLNLDAIEYTKLVIEAKRGKDLNVMLSQFDVQNAQVDLTGTGQVTYARGTAIPDQVLTANLSLNGKADMAAMLQKIKLAGATTPSGYTQGPQFQVGGTLQHPDYKVFYNLMLQAATAAGFK